jgi:hypothetical protein
VQFRSAIFSIFKVTFGLPDEQRLTEWQFQGHSQPVEVLVFSYGNQAAISAFAENSASSSGLGRAKSCRGRAHRRGALRGLREKFEDGFLIKVKPKAGKFLADPGRGASYDSPGSQFLLIHLLLFQHFCLHLLSYRRRNEAIHYSIE